MKLPAAPRNEQSPPDESGNRIPRRSTTRGRRSTPGAGSPGNLPLHRTSFIGRQAEVAQLGRLLRDDAVVTLTGAGGSGKTRLALETARRVAKVELVRFVDLAGLRSPELVPSAVASALRARAAAGMPLEETIVAAIGRRQLLLILDNCEHLVESAAHLVALLTVRCRSLTVLTTSRIPLRIAGETVIVVQPLRIEDEAVALFTDRARSVSSGFVRTDANQVAIEEICRRLDGVPLAIELAATWVAVMSPTELLPLLEHRFDILAHGSRTADGGVLTHREREVAGLVARGCTNRQIAQSLHLSTRTAESHVEHILNKPAFTTRAQIAAWAVATGATELPDDPALAQSGSR